MNSKSSGRREPGRSQQAYAPDSRGAEYALTDHVFVDLESARYHIVFDVRRKRAFVKSTLRFRTAAAGKPVFDMDCDPDALDAWLHLPNRLKRIGCKRVAAPGGIVELRSLDAHLEPGVHTVDIVHWLDDMNPNEDRAGEAEHLRWDDGEVRCAFYMSDLRLPGRSRRFLDRYLPSNLEYDQFAMTVRVQLRGSTVPHLLIANRGMEKQEDGVWEIEHPAHYTTSFPWFHLAPRDSLATRRFSYRGVVGLVYGRAGSAAADRLRYFEPAVIDSLRELELHFGRYPYEHVTVFAHELLAGGGMEYAGATMTNFTSLRHELEHSYFARCVAPVNGNAGWIDEAIAAWGDLGYFSRDEPPETDLSDARAPGLGGRSPYLRVTDPRAYSLGRDFLAYLDHVFVYEAGVPGGLRRFLKHYFATMRGRRVSCEDFEKLAIAFYEREAAKGSKPALDGLFDEYVNRPATDPGSTPKAHGGVRRSPTPIRRERCAIHQNTDTEIVRTLFD